MKVMNGGHSNLARCVFRGEPAAMSVGTVRCARRTLALSARAHTVAARRFDVAMGRDTIGHIALDDPLIARSEKDAPRRVVCVGRPHAPTQDQQMTTLLPRPLRTLLALGALSLVGACDESVGPRGAEAVTYVAVSVDDRPLPHTIYQGADEFLRLHADTIVLDGRGRATRATRVEHTWYGEEVASPPRTEMEYDLEGEVLTLGRPAACANPALCAGAEVGRLRGGEIEMTAGWFVGRRRYVRVSD